MEVPVSCFAPFHHLSFCRTLSSAAYDTARKPTFRQLLPPAETDKKPALERTILSVLPYACGNNPTPTHLFFLSLSLLLLPPPIFYFEHRKHLNTYPCFYSVRKDGASKNNNRNVIWLVDLELDPRSTRKESVYYRNPKFRFTDDPYREPLSAIAQELEDQVAYYKEEEER